MTELLKFLSTNSPAALAFAVAVLILAVTVSVVLATIHRRTAKTADAAGKRI
jgi:hypothetical protein